MRVHVARNRKLVISSICTVANYEYGFYFNFALDGSVELEVKATGIVNAYCLKPDEPLDHPHEVYVAPQIAAQHHQHVSLEPYQDGCIWLDDSGWSLTVQLFSYRVDPMIDGLQNQVVQVDIDVDEAPVQSDSNFYGNGFRTFKKVYETAKGAVADYDASKCRSWVIENPNKKHYCSGGNVGYKISKPLCYAQDRNTDRKCPRICLLCSPSPDHWFTTERPLPDIM
jgi:primary-amine oxidase